MIIYEVYITDESLGNTHTTFTQHAYHVNCIAVGGNSQLIVNYAAKMLGHTWLHGYGFVAWSHKGIACRKSSLTRWLHKHLFEVPESRHVID